MKNVFEVTAHGLQVDGRNIMPGSTLILGAPAPSHWQRFGAAGQVSDKEMVVATPPQVDGGDVVVPVAEESIRAMDKSAIVAMLTEAELQFDGRSGVDALRDFAVEQFVKK